jgi:hypothetical protein
MKKKKDKIKWRWKFWKIKLTPEQEEKVDRFMVGYWKTWFFIELAGMLWAIWFLATQP